MLEFAQLVQEPLHHLLTHMKVVLVLDQQLVLVVYQDISYQLEHVLHVLEMQSNVIQLQSSQYVHLLLLQQPE